MAEKINALLLTGQNNHPWRVSTPFLRKMFEDAGDMEVRIAEDPAILETKPAERYDILISNFNRNPRLSPAQEAGLMAFAKPNKGVVIYHAADNAFPGWDEYERMVGALWRNKTDIFAGTYHPPYGPYHVRINDRNHPITRGVSDFDHSDELYSNLWRHPRAEIHVLASGVPETGVSAGKPQPLVMTVDYDGARVFHQALGHDVKAMENPNFIELTVRGARWAAGRL